MELDKLPTYGRIKTHIHLQVPDGLHLERAGQGVRAEIKRTPQSGAAAEAVVRSVCGLALGGAPSNGGCHGRRASRTVALHQEANNENY